MGMGGRGKDQVKTYSLGMKQRLGIAAAMLSDPDLLLLDEPANGLDPGGMVAMRETLRYFTEQLGKTVVISSHLLHEVEQLADVVGIIDQWPAAARGRPPAAARRRRPGQGPRRACTRCRAAAEILRRFAPDRPLYGVDSGDQAGSVHGRRGARRAAEINKRPGRCRHLRLGLEPGSDLETLFLELTGSGGAVARSTDGASASPARRTAAARLEPRL